MMSITLRPSSQIFNWYEHFLPALQFMRLQGKRNRGKEEVKFLEIKGDDQLSGNQQWMTKSMTEEKQNRQSFSKVTWLIHYGVSCWRPRTDTVGWKVVLRSMLMILLSFWKVEGICAFYSLETEETWSPPARRMFDVESKNIFNGQKMSSWLMTVSVSLQKKFITTRLT